MSATAIPVPAASWWDAPVLLSLSGGEPATRLAGLSLAQLFGRVQGDDESAFDELYLRTQARLRTVAQSVLRSRDLAEDVVQESYLQIWRQRHQFCADQGALLGWMTTITRRRAIDRVRSISRAPKVEECRTAETTTVDTDHQTAVADAVCAARTMRPALLVLTRREREVVLLTYRHDQTAAQSAQLLGIPVPTLKSRLHAALTRLRRLLDADSFRV